MDRAQYMRERYHERKDALIEMLGGQCRRCGATSDLQMDHIDPSTKELELADMRSVSMERFWAEVVKCQLLCISCHDEKTLAEQLASAPPSAHGSLNRYLRHRCRCDVCREGYRKWHREYRKMRKVS